MNTVMNIRVPQNVENFLTDEDVVLKQDCSTQLVCLCRIRLSGTGCRTSAQVPLGGRGGGGGLCSSNYYRNYSHIFRNPAYCDGNSIHMRGGGQVKANVLF